jgi:hypothetical protein
MKQQKLLTFFLSFYLFLTVPSAYSDSATPENLSFSSAITLSLDQLDKSPYKSLDVQTVSGSFSGDFVSKTEEVLILRNKTNSIHMKSGKEKIILTYIDVSKITAISVYVLSE